MQTHNTAHAQTQSRGAGVMCFFPGTITRKNVESAGRAAVGKVRKESALVRCRRAESAE